MRAPINIQRLLPDIVPAPRRTNGESEASGTMTLFCASIVVINRSGGSWFGTNCIRSVTASRAPRSSKWASPSHLARLVDDFGDGYTAPA